MIVVTDVIDALAREAARIVEGLNGFAEASPKRAFELARADVLSRGAVALRALDDLFQELRVRKYECGRCGGTRFKVATEGASVVVACGAVTTVGLDICVHTASAPSLWDALQAWARGAPEDRVLLDDPRADEEELQPPPPEGGYVE